MDEWKEIKTDDITFSTYGDFKKELDAELQKTSESFVRIGYLLKLALETDILKESGYFNVNDFAKQEYGLDPTQVSRFININNRFSENGNSPYLKEQYRGIGYAKLAIMLQLPDTINEEITPAFSKAEVQAIKEEVDAEKQKSEIEVWLEGTPENRQDSTLADVLFQLGHDERELYTEACGIISGKDEPAIKELQEALAPAGENIYSVRIQGTGRLLLSIKDTGKPVTTTNIRTNEKESHTWEQLTETWKAIMAEAGTPEESWEKVYGEPFRTEKEEKQETAPVQRKKPKVTKAKVEPEKKENPAAVQEKPENAANTENNVFKTEENVAETEKNVSETEENVFKTEENVSKTEETDTKEPESIPAAGQQEEQMAGQTSIQEDFPEYMPEEAVDQKNSNAAEIVHHLEELYKEKITRAIRRLEEMKKQERWQAVITAAKDIQWNAEQIIKQITNKKEEEEQHADE